MIKKIIIWLYLFLFLLVVADEITTYIGLNKGLTEENQLYINHSEIGDEDYGVSKEDVKLNRELYNLDL